MAARYEMLRWTTRELLVEEGERPCRVVGNAMQKIESAIELNIIKVINGVHAIPGE